MPAGHAHSTIGTPVLVAVAAGVVLLPLQWWPRFPLPGLTVSDVLFVAAFLMIAVSARSLRGVSWSAIHRPGRGPLLALVLFGLGTTASAMANGGDYLKLVGHWELAALCGSVALLAVEPDHAFALRRALVAAALLGAATVVVGGVLWGLGIETLLLNPGPGDLEPGSYPRLRGTAVRANMVASIVATGSCLIVVEPKVLGRGRLRGPIAGCLCAAALLLTFSRTVPAVALLIVAVVGRRKSRGVTFWLVWGISASLYLAGLVVASRYRIVLNPARLHEVAIDFATEGTRWRFGRAAWQAVLEHPVAGWGPGSVPATGFSAHFTWLNLWAVLGVVPLVAFAYIFWRLLDRKLAARDPGAYLALTLFAVDSLHRDIEDMRHLWVVLGLLLGALLTSPSRKSCETSFLVDLPSK